MNKIYVPYEYDELCVKVIDKDTIRVVTSETSYIDFFVNSHYLYKEENLIEDTIFGCIPQSQLTNDPMYRNDLMDIIVVLFIFILLLIYFPYKIISRMFGRWLKI